MKNLLIPSAIGSLLIGFSILAYQSTNHQSTNHQSTDPDSPEPSDYLWAQRAFPYGTVPSDTYYAAIEWTKNQAQARGGGAEWQLVGPTNVGGRITDIAMHPGDQQTMYAATASGGVWKSDNAGDTWFSITDALPSLSIGDIALDPSDKNTIYVGTGEPNGGGGSITYDGRGVYKSTDAGSSWTALGLEETGSIGRIEVDPAHPNRIFVAAMGHLFANNPERGIFRSEDGGASWQKTLFVNDSTGFIDLAINPLHPDTVFAVSWQRTRRPNKRVYGGPGCAIWRSTDGGSNWAKLSLGLPSSNIGRIGIGISPSQPSTLYAIYADESGNFKGIYKSTDDGNVWAQLNGGDPGYPGYGWWFGQIRVHPNNPDEVYAMGLDWTKTTDGGQFWSGVSEYLHADYHALYIHPANPELQVVGNDGGVFVSKDAGITWSHRPFPVTQFYTSEIDFQHPSNLYGGVQDNGTWRTTTGNLDDWEHIFGGDGFVTLVNPLNNAIYYGESQYGGFSGSNGASAPSSSRYNWNTPYIFDPQNPAVMYLGAEKLFKSINGGLNWTPISTDLSNGPTGQNGVQYGTITTIAASYANNQVLWAGTDDGNVWVTSNGGSNWTKVSASLPKRWVTRVVAVPNDEQWALVCLSGYRHFEDIAHVYLTTNKGQSWQNVSANLPDVPVNDLVVDPSDPYNIWYIGTDAGVFRTTDGGGSWQPFNTGLPLVPVTDLTVHAGTRSIVAATFGRSMFRAEMPPSVSTHSPQKMDNVLVAPNPVLDQVKISFVLREKQALRLDLFDLSGKQIKTGFAGELSAGKQDIEMDVNGLPKGIYLLKIGGEQGFVFGQKIVKQ